MENSITLHSEVKVSDLDMSVLPLYNFHIVLVVEPDVESWALPEHEEDNLWRLLEMYADLIVEEALGDLDSQVIATPHASDVEHTMLIMASENLGTFYFEEVGEFSSFIVNGNDYEFDKLRMLLDGISKNHPDWKRVAIVGGAYEDEIIRAANAVQEAGFEAAIVKRYCVSENIFVNLDDLIEKVMAERMRLLGEGEDDDLLGTE